MNSSKVWNSSCRIAISIVWSASIIPAAGFTCYEISNDGYVCRQTEICMEIVSNKSHICLFEDF